MAVKITLLIKQNKIVLQIFVSNHVFYLLSGTDGF